MSLKRIAVIDYDKCYPDKCGWLCQRKCPVNRSGSDCITQDTVKFKAVISEELCTGCGICPKICPFGAITIINLDVDFGEPIHSYGKNAFRLYRLPLPRKGNVTGIDNSVLRGNISDELDNAREVETIVSCGKCNIAG